MPDADFVRDYRFVQDGLGNTLGREMLPSCRGRECDVAVDRLRLAPEVVSGPVPHRTWIAR